MYKLARFADARNTAEGKFIATMLSVLLVFSFLNVTMFTDSAGAAEGDEAETEQLEDQLADKAGESGEASLSESESEGDSGDEESSSGDASEQEGEQSGAATSNEGEGDIQGDEESVANGNDSSNSEGTDENETEQEAEAPHVAFADGVLTISNVDGLTKEAVQGYLSELNIKASDVTALKLRNVGNIARDAFTNFGSTVKRIDVNGAGEIAGYAFYMWAAVEEVSISNAQIIGERAFFKCPELQSVALESIDEIGTNAFAESKKVAEVALDGIGLVQAEAFRQCSALTDLIMTNIEEFDRSPFSYCTGLTSLTIDGEKDGISSLGTTMFYGCTGLRTVSLSNINTLGLQLFNGCTGIETAHLINVESLGGQVFYGCTDLKEVHIDGGFNASGNSLLQNCSSSVRLTIENVEAIPEEAFVGATAIENVDLINVGIVGKNAFASCKGIKNATLSDVGTVGQYAFYNCTGLEEVSAEAVEAIDNYAFYNCTGLKTATLSDVGTVGQYAFYNCTGLEKVAMEAVDVIDNYAFWGCKNLSTIASLQDVKTIGGFAFYGCSSLTGLTVDDATKMGYVGSNDEIMGRVEDILAGKFKLDPPTTIRALQLDEGWTTGAVGQSSNWNTYENGTQISQQARWANVEQGVAEVKVDAYYTGQKQMDYIFVADLSASMAQRGNEADSNARFYDMQSKLLDMTGKLLGTPGYDCRVAIVTFGGLHAGNATQESSGFMTSATEAADYIKQLEPLNENTDYALGLNEALKLAKAQDEARNTTMVFLSDGRPTYDGPTQLKTVAQLKENDEKIAGIAQQIRDAGVDGIYGVLHSPGTAAVKYAENAMAAVCGADNYYTSIDTESFGRAMNAAFTGAYGQHTVTIPVNSADFSVSNIVASAGVCSYEAGVLTWTVNDTPFTKHTLTYTMNLTADNLNKTGTSRYLVNNGDAAFEGAGASAGVKLTLTRTVATPEVPVVMGSYQVTHEYVTNGVADGSYTETFTVPVGTQVSAADVTPRPVYNGLQYEPTDRSGALTVVEGTIGTITLRYTRTEQEGPGGEDPVPTPGPTDPDPTEPDPSPVDPVDPMPNPGGTVPTTPAPTVPTPGTTTNPAAPAPTATVVTPAAAPGTVITANDTPAAEGEDTATAAPANDFAAPETIADDATPQAAAPAADNGTTIDDDATPMGAFEEDHPDCWAHWLMILGLVATAIYGIAVVRRRLGMKDDIDDYEDQILGRSDASQTTNVTADGRQAL
ncbi:leucine-rich repeat protein [Adlercreutzia equolifaciens]|uniref:leucine-rich repeat protein n=1 Tax=Adlercreutzia equolifaciens TaxID=446660 RepID=UPI0023B10AB4|nr:leucine-rich repeat protein [Adlercreutzia equolifaciens]MDE8701643.1 leucine-rich repeat protein [Adlercreutzia equolifaciens]